MKTKYSSPLQMKLAGSRNWIISRCFKELDYIQVLQGIEINNNSSRYSNLLKCSPAIQASRFNDFVYVSMITIRMLVIHSPA